MTCLVGRSAAMRVLEDEIDRAARSDAEVLGESGVGKAAAARLIHHRSPRASAAMVVVTCAGLPDELLESELFGHVKGAFSGAYRDKPGLLEMAQDGTVRVDDVGDMSIRLQLRSPGRPHEVAKRLSPDALAALVAYRWPGNVRELKSAVERAMLMAPGAAFAARGGSRPSHRDGRCARRMQADFHHGLLASGGPGRLLDGPGASRDGIRHAIARVSTLPDQRVGGLAGSSHLFAGPRCQLRTEPGRDRDADRRACHESNRHAIIAVALHRSTFPDLLYGARFCSTSTSAWAEAGTATPSPPMMVRALSLRP